jgi:nicotinamide-nucleotide amidase
MKKFISEVVSTGTEIMQGVYPDTNAREISHRLQKLGILPLYHTAVGDDKKTLLDILGIARNRTDVIIMTGGLGPTVDDLTRDVVSELYGKPLVPDRKAADMIRARFAARRKHMPESNLTQALLPAGSIPLYNENGTAPGFIIYEETLHKALIALPGPPREWIPMFDNFVADFLKTHFPSSAIIDTLVLRTIDIPESQLNEQLKPLFNTLPGVTFAFTFRPGKVDIRLTASAPSSEETCQLLEDARKKILRLIDPECIYGEGDEATIEAEVGRLLTARKKTLAIAESCTGGLLCKRLTDIPGSSNYLKEGIVAYSDEAKVKYLGVRDETLRHYGAVSGETVAEMATGMKRVSGADIAVGITGIAGPSGGSQEKPVGLVYFGLATEDSIITCQRRFTGERCLIRELAADFALDMLRRTLISSTDEPDMR